ncbi:hypothetical protein [Phaffia rhodozyma]|uniref:BTB domain-containing protein n=1 Tax=Phaffia rhodozyma TaxID=264483 RepID=A0A0F7SQH1_PHARH|nr:hypothetical protein [Phaffia rhodozyma]
MSDNTPNSNEDLVLLDPEGDIILESSDGLALVVRKVQLQANSAVFVDMLQLALSGNLIGGKPVVKLSDMGSDLKLFLSFIVPSMRRARYLAIEDCNRIIDMADKYDTPIIRDFILTYLRVFTEMDHINVFGLAVVYRDAELARQALFHFRSGSDFSHCKGPSRCINGCSRALPSLDTPHLKSDSLADISKANLERFHAQDIINFARLHEMVLWSDLTWKDVAIDFHLD